MALPLYNSANAGTQGVTVTSGSGGNSASTGDYFTAIVGEVTFDSSHAAESMGIKCAQAVSGQAKVTWGSVQVGSITSGYVFTRHYLWITAAPSVNLLILQNRGAAANTSLLRLTTGRTVDLLNQNSQVSFSSGAVTLPLQQMIRVETRTLVHATAGRLEARFFWADGSGKTEHSAVGSPALTIGDDVTDVPTRGTLDEVHFGMMTAATGNTHYIDEIGVRTTDWWGPITLAPPPPTDAADFKLLDGGGWNRRGVVKRLNAAGTAWV